MGARLAENGAFYIYTVFVLVYGTQQVGMDRQTILNGVLVARRMRARRHPASSARCRIGWDDGRCICSARR